MNTILTLKPSELEETDVMNSILIEKLIESMVGRCYENAYICDIVEIDPIQNGRVKSNGNVDYSIDFKAKVYAPKINDVLAGDVQKVISNGLFIKNAPFRCFVARQMFPDDVWNQVKLSSQMAVELKEFRYNYNEIMCIGEPVLN